MMRSAASEHPQPSAVKRRYARESDGRWSRVRTILQAVVAVPVDGTPVAVVVAGATAVRQQHALEGAVGVDEHGAAMLQARRGLGDDQRRRQGGGGAPLRCCPRSCSCEPQPLCSPTGPPPRRAAHKQVLAAHGGRGLRTFVATRAPGRKEERTRLAALASKAQPLIVTRPVLPCTSAAPPSPCARALMRMRASVTRQGNDTCGAHGRRAVAPEHAVGDRRRAAAVCREHSCSKACGVELEGAADDPRGARADDVDRAAELRSEHGSQQRRPDLGEGRLTLPALLAWKAACSTVSTLSET